MAAAATGGTKSFSINNALDLSIEMDSEELALFAAPITSHISKTQNPPAPAFQISAPMSIRASQFPMNETKPNETNFTQDMSAQSIGPKKSRPSCAYLKSEKKESSIMIIDDSFDSSNSSRVPMTSPFKYNSRTKEIDPFDIHVQNALLDDIHFIDYITQLDNVLVTTRIRAIEPDSDLVLDKGTIQIDQKIGQGSFGFVYR